MKKLLCAVLLTASLLILTACGNTSSNQQEQTENNPPENEQTENSQTENSQTEGKTVEPTESALDINSLDDCTFSAAFKASDVKLDDDGALVVTMTVCDYEHFDMVDIAGLIEGDILVIDGKEVKVTSIERDGQYVSINGGVEAGGYDLYTDEDGEYHEVIGDAGANYYVIGQVTLPIDQEFIFTDNSDPEEQGKQSYAGDFLIAMENSDDVFNANATTVRVSNGKIVEIIRNYMP